MRCLLRCGKGTCEREQETSHCQRKNMFHAASVSGGCASVRSKSEIDGRGSVIESPLLLAISSQKFAVPSTLWQLTKYVRRRTDIFPVRLEALSNRSMTVNRRIVTVFAACTLVCLPFASGADAAAPHLTAIEGLVRDVACPIQNHDSTATSFNLECARACARSGSPLIILTKAGDIYFPITDKMPDPSQRQRLMPFVGKYVHASGQVFERNGTRAIAITEIHEMKGVRLNSTAE